MKRVIIILFFFVRVVTYVMGQPFLAQAKSEDCYRSIVETNRVVKELDVKNKRDLSRPVYFTYVFSNKCGFPTVDVYCRENSPLLLHDGKYNAMFYLGYCSMEGDTTLFYTDFQDFWPNGVAEHYVKGFALIRDTLFDNYLYRMSAGYVKWYERTDDGAVHHYKISKKGKLKKISAKKCSKVSKWYIQTYRVTPPPCPPPALPDASLLNKWRQKNRIRRFNNYWGIKE